jgi:hypothetical protein
MGYHTPIFIVASPRPRVGKTLVARMLAEYFHADGRPVAAFDVNPDEFTLMEYLPADTAAAGIDDIRDQMVLIDQLVTPDRVPKIVDLGQSQFEKFFAVLHEIAFAREARTQSIVPVVLYVADGDRRTRRGYDLLLRRFAEVALVPVINEAVPIASRYRHDFPATQLGGSPLTIPALAPVIRTVIERPGFSFAEYSARAHDTTAELYGWTRKVFLEFRDLELRLLLEELRPTLRLSA